jgi:hypothetical protein
MKFMLMQAYGEIARDDVPMMGEWAPEAIEAHIQFQKDLNSELKERGEFIDAQALATPELAKFVVSGGQETVVTDGPFPESKELLAGYRMIDVESTERALEIAARASAAPAHDGAPIQQAIEVREVMGPIEH